MSAAARKDSKSRPDGMYSSGEVARLCGCQPRTLDYWVRAGLTIPRINPAGAGHDRWWSTEDLIAVAIAVVLDDFGMETRAKAINMFRHRPDSDLVTLGLSDCHSLTINIAALRSDLGI